MEQLLCDELIDLSEDLRRPMSATVTTQYKDAGLMSLRVYFLGRVC